MVSARSLFGQLINKGILRLIYFVCVQHIYALFRGTFNMLKLQTIFGFSYLSPLCSERNLGFSIFIQIKNNLKIFMYMAYPLRCEWLLMRNLNKLQISTSMYPEGWVTEDLTDMFVRFHNLIKLLTSADWQSPQSGMKMNINSGSK